MVITSLFCLELPKPGEDFVLKQTVHRLGRSYIRAVTKSESDAQRVGSLNERPIEMAFVFGAIRDFAPKNVLDVGTGQSPFPALLQNCGCHVTAIDNVRDYWPAGMINRHWHVVDDDVRNPRATKSGFDMITCISVIEHIDDPQSAFASMIGLLRPGGILLLTCPYNETRFVENVYKLPNAYGVDPNIAYKCSSYDGEHVSQWMTAEPSKIIRQELWKCWTGDVWRQGQVVSPAVQSSANERHQLLCAAIMKPSAA